MHRLTWYHFTPFRVLIGVGLVLFVQLGCETQVQGDTSQTTSEPDSLDPDLSAAESLTVAETDSGVSLELGFSEVSERVFSVTQGSISSEWMVTEAASTLELSRDQLSEFSRGQLSWRLSSGDDILSEGTAVLGERFTGFYDWIIPREQALVLTGLPQFAPVGSQASVSTTAGPSGVRGQVFVGTPSGPVVRIDIGGAVIPSGGEIGFQVEFEEEGMYVVEVLAPAGTPVANVPVYVGSYWPMFLPALDTLPGVDIKTELPLELFRDTVIGLLNAKRADAGLSPVSGDDALDAVSQQKAQLMADEQYLSHTSRDGVEVGERLSSAGLDGMYRENIAAERGPERVFWSWWWSPSHREPYMEGRWTRTGFGAAYFQPGLAAFAQHFLE